MEIRDYFKTLKDYYAFERVFHSKEQEIREMVEQKMKEERYDGGGSYAVANSFPVMEVVDKLFSELEDIAQLDINIYLYTESEFTATLRLEEDDYTTFSATIPHAWIRQSCVEPMVTISSFPEEVQEALTNIRIDELTEDIRQILFALTYSFYKALLEVKHFIILVDKEEGEKKRFKFLWEGLIPYTVLETVFSKMENAPRYMRRQKGRPILGYADYLPMMLGVRPIDSSLFAPIENTYVARDSMAGKYLNLNKLLDKEAHSGRMVIKMDHRILSSVIYNNPLFRIGHPTPGFIQGEEYINVDSVAWNGLSQIYGRIKSNSSFGSNYIIKEFDFYLKAPFSSIFSSKPETLKNKYFLSWKRYSNTSIFFQNSVGQTLYLLKYRDLNSDDSREEDQETSLFFVQAE